MKEKLGPGASTVNIPMDFALLGSKFLLLNSDCYIMGSGDTCNFQFEQLKKEHCKITKTGKREWWIEAYENDM